MMRANNNNNNDDDKSGEFSLPWSFLIRNFYLFSKKLDELLMALDVIELK